MPARSRWAEAVLRAQRKLAGAGCGDYIEFAGLLGASETYSRGLTISKGAVPDRARGLGHMAPTYLCRFPGSNSDGFCGSALTPYPMLAFRPSYGPRPRMTEHDVIDAPEIAELKKVIRREAVARRDALPAAERARAAETIAARPFPLAIRPGAIVS